MLARHQAGQRFCLERGNHKDVCEEHDHKACHPYLPRSSAGSKLVIMVRHMGFTSDLKTPSPIATYICQLSKAKPFIRLLEQWLSRETSASHRIAELVHCQSKGSWVIGQAPI